MTNYNVEALKKMRSEIATFVKANYRSLLELNFFIASSLGIFLSNDRNKILWFVFLIFCFILLIGLCKFIRTKREIRKPIKRFTKRNKDGDIFVEEEKLHQALIYLCILEDQQEGL